jgi:NAD kinase
MFDKIVVITRRTPLEMLTQRLGTKSQAKFYLEQEATRGGTGFAAYENEDTAYGRARECLQRALPKAIRAQWIERDFLPTFTFGPRDLIVTLGSDGLIVNTAKYASGIPILAFRPDGVAAESQLAPVAVGQATVLLSKAIAGTLTPRSITMACATLGDGRQIHAVNELFIGPRTHTSARYQLTIDEQSEQQSSSGILVATGTGSTGWLRAICAGAAKIMGAAQITGVATDPAFPADSEQLIYAVREPWPSRTTAATLVYGQIYQGQCLEIVSQMPTGGVIFSDGVESDFLAFESGAVAKIGISDRRLLLLR